MARPSFRPVTPDQRIRDLRKEFRGFDKEEPGPDRAARLAAFTRAAHAERQLNMAMHTAALCLDEDPDAPDLLVDAYLLDDGGPADTEERLRALVDLQDLARYIDRADISERVTARLHDEARAWARDGDPAERRHRLRTLSSMISREFADGIRDELEFLG